MNKEEMPKECCVGKSKCNHQHCGGVGGGSPIYCLGVVGALFYFLEGVSGFGPILFGIGKAFVWPAILMFKLLSYLNI